MMDDKRIALTDYNPDWADQFERLKAVLSDSLGDDFIGIAHIGTASVPGMKAGKLKTRNTIKILELYKYPDVIIKDARATEQSNFVN